jgi:Family of unknown function (DUF6279)
MCKVMRHWRIAWVVTALLFISACSGATIVYNRLDFLLPWYIDDYAELNQAQKAYLDELLAPFLTWHRTQELPNYVKILEDIEDRIQSPMKPADVAAVFAEIEQAWLRLEGAALDRLLDLGERLSDEQIAGFLDVLNERQQEYEKEYLARSDEEFYQDSYDNLRDSVRDYLGRLSEQQRDILRNASRQLHRSDHTWLQGRAEWLQELAVLLQRQPGWQDKIRAQVAARSDNTPPEHRRVYEHNMGVIYEALTQLLNSRSDQQDQHLRTKLSELQEDVGTLIAQGNAPAQASSG